MTSQTRLEFDLRRHRLGNGLEVVLHRDPSLPLVATNLWYHVGSKNERPGKTGFAHLFEHLLFQGSQHVGTNDHFRYIQQAGGVSNGSTWFDRTNYHEVLPAHQLELALWLESDRMGFFLPSITEEKLENQRDVVMNERRQRIDNQPYGRAFERLHELLYGKDHPYSWPVIGYMADIERASLDDVRDFFQRYYIPNNAVLTLAGDFEYTEALEQVERYFGPLEPGEPVIPVRPPRAARSGERRDVLEDRVGRARRYWAFRVPPYGTDAWYTADVLANLLTEGKSSLLYQDLVYDRRLFQDVSSGVLPTEMDSTFMIIGTVRPEIDLDEAERAFEDHLNAIAATPPAVELLDRARHQLLTHHFTQLQTLERRADLMSHFTTFFDRPEDVAREAERYQSPTGEDLAHLVETYCQPHQRAAVRVIPGASLP